MNLRKLRISIVLLLMLMMTIWTTQNVLASHEKSVNFLAPLQSDDLVFRSPLGDKDSITFAPRKTYDNDDVLIENTDYGIKNPDLKGRLSGALRGNPHI